MNPRLSVTPTVAGKRREKLKGEGGFTVERDVVVAVTDDEGRVRSLLPRECGFLGWGAGEGCSVRCAAFVQTFVWTVAGRIWAIYSTSKSAVTKSMGCVNGKGLIGAVAYGHAEHQSRTCQVMVWPML